MRQLIVYRKVSESYSKASQRPQSFEYHVAKNGIES